MTEHSHSEYRWGEKDRIGADNLLTAETRLAALRSIKRGQIYDLSHTIGEGAPTVGPHQTSYSLKTKSWPRDGIENRRKAGAVNDAGATMEHIEMSVHVGTHIDALGHFTIGENMYGGYTIGDSVGESGIENLGIDQMPPVITRGVCLDVSSLDGGDYLDGGRAVTADDLAAATSAAGIEIGVGDVVCIHTGWGRFYESDPERYAKTEPGIGVEAARWLTAQEICGVASDNMAIEVTPGVDHPRIQYPVHQHLLVEAGVYMIENIVLDELVRDGVAEFCFILLPVKLKNATGCPVRPIAVI
jgi:kynurenine formamidase